MDTNFLDKSEEIALSLEKIYSQFGYSKYKMNRFEEYSFYMNNEKFLEDNRLITFYDPHGKLLALKPDITMSVIKSCLKSPNINHKMYYNESVFRVPSDGMDFREIHQIGAEFIGNIDLYQTMEMLNLACKSLEEISENYVLCLSSMALILNIFKDLDLEQAHRNAIIAYLRQKNLHDLERYIKENEIQNAEVFSKLLSLSSDVILGIAQLKELFNGENFLKEVKLLEDIISNLEVIAPLNKFRLDLSYIANLEYYTGLYFVGYIDGLANHVLAGGRYDKLLSKMGLQNANALGFAVYLSSVEPILEAKVIAKEEISYCETCDVKALLQKANALLKDGKSFSMEKKGDLSC